MHTPRGTVAPSTCKDRQAAWDGSLRPLYLSGGVNVSRRAPIQICRVRDSCYQLLRLFKSISHRVCMGNSHVMARRHGEAPRGGPHSEAPKRDSPRPLPHSRSRRPACHDGNFQFVTYGVKEPSAKEIENILCRTPLCKLVCTIFTLQRIQKNALAK